MPFGDGTGSRTQGPMTGRGRGYCAGFNSPGYTKGAPRGGGGFGRGFGRGHCPGRGFGCGFARGPQAPDANPVNPNVNQGQYGGYDSQADYKQSLKNEINRLEQIQENTTQRIENIKQELSELESEE